MCIIVYKPPGIDLPNDDILYNCSDSNPDGIGFMYRNDDGKIIINKGILTVRDLLKELSRVPDIKSRDLAVHFRYATHGDKSPGNTHPFPMSCNIREMRRLHNRVDCAIMHNGVVLGLPQHRDISLSDTMCFIKQIIALGMDNEGIVKILNQGKFLIMDSKETKMYGTFINDGGIYYSNNGYIDGFANSYGMTIKDIQEYNAICGTNFKTLEEIEAHMDMLDMCLNCVWYDEQDDICCVMSKVPNPLDDRCSYMEYYDETGDNWRPNSYAKRYPEHYREDR